MDPQDPNTNKSFDTDQLGARHTADAEQTGKDMQADQPEQSQAGFPARKSKFRAVKTYKDYAAESLRKGGGSLTKMIIAERKKKERKERRSGANPKNIIVSILAVVFVVLGMGLVIGSYLLVQHIQTTDSGPDAQLILPEPILIYDYRKEAFLSTLTRSRVLDKAKEEILDTGIEVGAVKYVYFTSENDQGVRYLLPADELLSTVRAKLPGDFGRVLDDNYMYGIYSTTENSPFLVLKTTAYDQSFAGMFEWERSLGQDVGALFGRGNFDFSKAPFVDIVLFNRDVRAVLDQSGEVVLAYTFVDKSTVVIFANKLALRELTSRMQRNTVKQ